MPAMPMVSYGPFLSRCGLLVLLASSLTPQPHQPCAALRALRALRAQSGAPGRPRRRSLKRPKGPEVVEARRAAPRAPGFVEGLVRPAVIHEDELGAEDVMLLDRQVLAKCLVSSY